MLKLLPHLENDLAWRRVHHLEMKLQLAPASQKNSVKERLLFWKGRVDPRFPAPATAFRAPEFPEWQKLTIPQLKGLLLEKKEKTTGLRKKAEFLQRLNDWARRRALEVGASRCVFFGCSPSYRVVLCSAS